MVQPRAVGINRATLIASFMSLLSRAMHEDHDKKLRKGHEDKKKRREKTIHGITPLQASVHGADGGTIRIDAALRVIAAPAPATGEIRSARKVAPLP